jgi:hypothetical protein
MLLDPLSKELIVPSCGFGRCTSLMHGGYGQSTEHVVCHVAKEATWSMPRKTDPSSL